MMNKARLSVLSVAAMLMMAAVLLASGGVPVSAQSQGEGKLAFSSERDNPYTGASSIYSMNADGSSPTRLTSDTAYDTSPVWSPGNSKIAFSRDTTVNGRGSQVDIYVMNADGSSQTNLTNNSGAGNSFPTWSQDGKKIAFSNYRDGNGEIYVMNADGSSQTNLTNSPAFDSSPAWSPDGKKIAFLSNRDGNVEIYLMNADGSGVTRLTNSPLNERRPTWSPNSGKLAFTRGETGRNADFTHTEIYAINSDGSGETNLTNNSFYDAAPSWSADGSKIAFETDRDGEDNSEIYVMNADGSSQTNVTHSPGWDESPAWSNTAVAVTPTPVSAASPTSASVATTVTLPTPLPLPGSGSQTFPETGKVVTGIFLDYWKNNGGLPQQGFPISNVLNEKSDVNGQVYAVQYFERAVFEYHPEQTDPKYKVLLSQLGTFQYQRIYAAAGAPNQTPNIETGSVLVPETNKRLGGMFLNYWQSHGGLAQQGYPISDEFNEVSSLDGKTYKVQYFERAVFEYHPEEAQPQYRVLLSQLGTFRYKAKYEQPPTPTVSPATPTVSASPTP